MLSSLSSHSVGLTTTISVVAIVLHFTSTLSALRIKGSWNTNNARLTVLAKFGFQQTDPMEQADSKNSRGFIYGNISSDFNFESRAVLIIVPQILLPSFFVDSMYGQSCESMLKNVSSLAFETKCMPKGKGDIMRWVPCPKGHLCEDETDAAKVIDGYQMTLRVEEPYTPEYWYVLLIGCNLDANCSWIPTKDLITLHYDIWLTNGSPQLRYLNPFTHQFSFDEQDSAEMFLIFVLLYSMLCLCQWRALTLSHYPRIVPRQKLLTCIIATKTVGLILQCLNVVVFAYDGQGVMLARLFGEMLRLWSICCLCLLLLLLSRGWSLSDQPSTLLSSNRNAILIWSILTATHFALFFINFFFVDDVLHDIDVFKSWPGYGMLIIRMIQALWFLTEMRFSIDREDDEDRAEFLAHIGAGYLVWFIYPSALGVIVSFISVLWRFKIILGITTIANFLAITCLVHLFWPTSVNRRFFLSDVSFYRRMDRADSTELEDFERLLISSEAEVELDNPVVNDFHGGL